MEEVERKYWDADIAVEAEMEKIVIQVTSSDEDTDTATECSDYSSLQVYSGNFRFTIIVNNKKLYIHTNIQMKQGYDGLICLYNYIYDIFVCGFTYTLLHVTVNYICPMIFTKLFFIYFFFTGDQMLFFNSVLCFTNVTKHKYELSKTYRIPVFFFWYMY